MATKDVITDKKYRMRQKVSPVQQKKSTLAIRNVPMAKTLPASCPNRPLTAAGNSRRSS
jgi:hypothetical protein